MQRSWWKGTAKTLQLSVPIDWREAIGVTPQVLATDISVKLGEFIQVSLLHAACRDALPGLITNTCTQMHVIDAQGLG